MIYLAPGTRLGRYELLYPIASGGMARVWAAEQTGDLGFRKLVALKTILPDFAFDSAFRSMFLDEAQLASRILHVNVVEVLDLGVHGQIVFQAMTFIDGASLSMWLGQPREKQPPLGAGVRIMIDVLRGLHAAHELCDDTGTSLGLVHRDVSPQNVLVGSDGVAKLADFGIAKAFGRVTDETKGGAVKGKVAYMAPELLEGMPASPQSDLFSAGVVLWEVMTGARLFPRAAPGETTTSTQRRKAPVRDPREVVPDLPPQLAAIAMRALERDPYARYKNALEMADALEEIVRETKLDATPRHVASRLETDLGDMIRGQREAIRSARRLGPNSISGVAPIFQRSSRTSLPTVAGTPVVTSNPPSQLTPTPSGRKRSSLLVVLGALLVASIFLTVVAFRTTRTVTAAPRTDRTEARPPVSVAAPPVVMELPSPSASVQSTAKDPPPVQQPSRRVRPQGTVRQPAPPGSLPKPRFESPY
jgi:serine/threonine-protein kinase